MSTTRTCDHCHGEIHWATRADALYCSTRCRVAAHRAKASRIPPELLERPRWIRHERKRPITVTGRPASSTDPSTWSPYPDVIHSKAGDGPGFVLDGDGIVCIDLDHCIEGDRLAPWADEILTGANDTYIELSPSGTGLHIWGYADVPRGRVLHRDSGQVEIYGRSRYMTVTGSRFGQAPSHLGDLTPLVTQLLS